MSAGPFLISKYEADDGSVRPIRIQPETLGFLDNAEPSGGADGPYVKVSGSRRSFGLHPRKITISRSVGNADYGTGKAYASLPILTKQVFDDATVGSTVAYAGVDWVIASKTSESIR